jgi:outer membrane protein TolC
LAALYFSPALDSARARLQEADAAIVTAGARPNPVLDLSPGVPSPYLLSLDLNFPIETAGKRGDRIRSASGLDQAARFDLAEAAWKVRSRVRAALLDYVLASRKRELLSSEEQLRSKQTNLLEQRLTAGEIARTELDSAQIALSDTHLAVVAADGQIAEARAKLAAAMGVPPSALHGIEFSWTDLESPPEEESFSAEQIQRDAVLNRMDVQRTLAQYAASEADLQLEIAKQYPDVQIGPGYTYEEQQSYFTLGLSVTLPAFNRNQGPIAGAEARRKEAASVFLETQSQVIAESEQALTAYGEALHELSEGDQSLHRAVLDNRTLLIQRAAEVGEEDPLAVETVQINSNALDQTRLDAVTRAQTALGRLEDAVQRPLDAGDTFSAQPNAAVLAPPKEPRR